MQLLKIGNQLINPEKILHVTYLQTLNDPSPEHPQGLIKRECEVNFEREGFVRFYDAEAELVWSYLSASKHCRDLTPSEVEA